jgi:hypothetical protein
MSGVIVDENRCMQRLYVDICEKHSCRAKVYPKTDGDLKRKIRSTDMVILLTNTLSPKMKEVTVLTKRHNAIIELPCRRLWRIGAAVWKV